MAETTAAAPADLLRGLARVEWTDRRRGRPPVETWNPEFCGDIDMRIARDGTWHYMGSPIGRPPMVRLFASILRRDADGRYYLVTPAEKVGITVEDAPFLAVEMTATGKGRDQVLRFRTNVDDEVEAGAEHPIRVETDPETGAPAPYIRVHGRLDALIARSVYYDLVARAVEEEHEGARWLGVWSAGRFFPLGRASEAEAA